MTDTIQNVPRELEPCPFCGSEAGRATKKATWNLSRHRVACTNSGCGAHYGYWHPIEWNERALLSAPSPAGVDGLEVVRKACEAANCKYPEMDAMADFKRDVTPSVVIGLLDGIRHAKGIAAINDARANGCAETVQFLRLELSGATSIIDGLRGEVAELVKHSEVVAQWHADAMFAIRDLKDANAVRTDELERLLTRAQIWIVDETGPGWELSESIDAALSAGKEGE